eukprot:TRINITY_DN2092_c0_g4_i1.p1 TRINITY_DN2092_c0_g4~~TRINITY_DN2092_c0_g4_i1.p1  ORF type:complete len:768 (-),score=189.92 TRINITY_DN2092_c0_g4_i1:128-2431(-)
MKLLLIFLIATAICFPVASAFYYKGLMDLINILSSAQYIKEHGERIRTLLEQDPKVLKINIAHELILEVEMLLDKETPRKIDDKNRVTNLLSLKPLEEINLFYEDTNPNLRKLYPPDTALRKMVEESVSKIRYFSDKIKKFKIEFERKRSIVTGETNKEEFGINLKLHYNELYSGRDNVAASMKNNVLWYLLRGPLRGSWFEARQYLTLNYDWFSNIVNQQMRPTEETCLRLMNDFLGMREAKWNGFKDIFMFNLKKDIQALIKINQYKASPDIDSQTRQLYSNRLEVELNSNELANLLASVGSTSVTSDIDIPMKGFYTEYAVRKINKDFREHFKIPFDCGIVFDINVYALDWGHSIQEPMQGDLNQITKTIFVKPKYEFHEILSDNVNKQMLQVWDENNHLWALVKLCRNMHDGGKEWKNFEKSALEGFNQVEEKTSKIKNLLATSLKISQQVNSRVKAQIISLNDLLKVQKSKEYDLNDPVEAMAASVVASNSIYDYILEEVKELRLNIIINMEKEAKADKNLGKYVYQNSATSSQIIKNTVQYVKEFGGSKFFDAASALVPHLGFKIAEALTFANEVYASEGATWYTVNLQGAKRTGEAIDKQYPKFKGKFDKVEFIFPAADLIQSVFENMGDALHSLHYYKSIRPFYSVYRSGKYINRMMGSIRSLFGLTETDFNKAFLTKKEYDLLNKIGTYSVEAKEGKRTFGDLSMTGVPSAVLEWKINGQQFFLQFDNEANVDMVRSSLLEFSGVVANKIFKDKIVLS